jgi:prepilin-type N-terminal cleavage/methylation domain-containing protein
MMLLRKRHGFTMVEIMVTLTIIAVLSMAGIYSIRKVKTRESAREILRMLTSGAMEARAAALELGPAANVRVTVGPSCALPGNPFGVGNQGHSALYFQVNTTIGCAGGGNCDLMWVIGDVQRVPAGACPGPGCPFIGDTYLISCKSYDVRGRSSGGGQQDFMRLDPTNANWTGFRGAPGPDYWITYDDRGFAQIFNNGAARVPLIPLGGTTEATQIAHGVVVLGSGLACLQGSNLAGAVPECARGFR